MLDTAKSAITLAKEWRKGGDLPYRIIAVPASLLVLLSVARQERPSDLVAELFAFLGAQPLAGWFGTEAPPIITGGSATAEKVFLGLLCMVLLRMIVEPVFHELRGYARPGDHSLRTLFSRAPATLWLLLLPAIQQGPTTVFLQHPRATVAMAILGTICLFAAFVMAARIVKRFPSPSMGLWAGRSITFLKHLALATCCAYAAIVLIPVGLVFVACSWLSDSEAQVFKDARRERVHKEVENTPAPTGATRLPRTIDFPETLRP